MNFREMFLNVSKKYPNVKFRFAETVDAFRKVIGYSKEEIENNKLELSVFID